MLLRKGDWSPADVLQPRRQLRRCILRCERQHVPITVCLQVLLCALARALVMWDSVAPTETWIQAQLPTLLKVSGHRLCNCRSQCGGLPHAVST